MTKKRKMSLIALALSVVTLSSAIGVVAKKPEAVAEVKAEREVMIADFESFDHIYNISDTYYNITLDGYVTQSKADDPNNIDGRSLEVYSEGTISEFWSGFARNSGYPAAFSYDILYNTVYGGNYGFEWNYIKELSVDVKNVNDFELQVSMFMITEAAFPVGYGTTAVPAGEQVTLTAPLNRYYMQSEFNDVIRYVVLLVDYDSIVYGEEDLEGLRYEGNIKVGDLYMPPMRAYFDNLKWTVNENSVFDKNGAVIVDKKFESATEILNFNQSADLAYIREFGHNYVKDADNLWNTKNWEKGTGSALYYNSNEKYVHEGNVGSLEWRINPTLQSKFADVNFAYNTQQGCSFGDLLTGFTVVGEYLNYLNLSKLQSGEIKICVDVYNAAPYAKQVGFGIHDCSGVATEQKYEFPFNYGAKAPTDEWFTIPAGEWKTLEITDFSHLDLSQGIARLRLMTTLLDVTRPISMYVNNLRIEYVGKEA